MSSPCLCHQSATCPRHQPPSLPTSIFSDKSIALLKNPKRFIEDVIEDNGGSRVFVCRLFLRRCFVVASNPLVKSFLTGRDMHEKSYNGLRDFYSGLFDSSILFSDELAEIDNFRRILLPLLEPEKLMGGHYAESIERFCDRWMSEELGGPEAIVIYEKFKQFASQLVMKLFLELEGKEAEEMSKLATKHWHGIISVPVNFKLSCVMPSGYREAMEAKKILLRKIEERIKSRECEFLNKLLVDMGIEMVKNHVLVFICALIPKALSSIFASLVDSSGRWRPQYLRNDRISREDLKNIYLEIIRLFPPFFGGFRVVKEELVLGDYHVPKGYGVFYATFLAHRDPEIFPDADEFLPERWNTCNASDADKLFAFGAGPHSCLGQKLMWDIMLRVGDKLVNEYDWPCSTSCLPLTKKLPILRPAKLEPIELTKKIIN